MSLSWTSRDEEMTAILDGGHFRSRRDPAVQFQPGEVEQTVDRGLRLGAPSTVLTHRVTADFRRFAAMIGTKIQQCRIVRDVELPQSTKVARFYVWGTSP
jgi:hypothetical protein